MPVVWFAHVALNCRDMAATELFYVRYFGFVRARHVPVGGGQIVYLRAGQVCLELFAAEGKSPLPAPVKDGYTFPGIRHLAFQVDNVDAKLSEMGADARIMHGPICFDAFIRGWKTAWIADPDGTIVEISQGYVDQESPPRLQAKVSSSLSGEQS